MWNNFYSLRKSLVFLSVNFHWREQRHDWPALQDSGKGSTWAEYRCCKENVRFERFPLTLIKTSSSCLGESRLLKASCGKQSLETQITKCNQELQPNSFVACVCAASLPRTIPIRKAKGPCRGREVVGQQAWAKLYHLQQNHLKLCGDGETM
jgi:hypothetical protein